MVWTPQMMPRRQLERTMENNEACITALFENAESLVFQRSFDKVLAQLPKIRQLLFTEWEEAPTRLKEWLGRAEQCRTRVSC